MRHDIEDYYRMIPAPTPENPDRFVVKILKGAFEGLIIQYGKSRVGSVEEAEQRTDGRLPVTFEFDSLIVPENLQGRRVPIGEDAEISQLLGEILIHILMTRMISREPVKLELQGSDATKRTD